MLTALLDEAVNDAAYKCYDCKHLFAALHNSPHSLASATVSSVRSEESKEPPLEEFTTVAAAATQAEIDLDFVRSLELEFAAQSLQADQSRARNAQVRGAVLGLPQPAMQTTMQHAMSTPRPLV